MSRARTVVKAEPEADLASMTDAQLLAVFGCGAFTHPRRTFRELCQMKDVQATERFKREYRAARAAWAEYARRRGPKAGLPPWERQRHAPPPRLVRSVFDLIPEVVPTGIRAQRAAVQRAALDYRRAERARELARDRERGYVVVDAAAPREE